MPSIWITGIGLTTPVGMLREITWRSIRAGQSAARILNIPPADGSPPYIGFPIPGGDHRAFVQVLNASIEARKDSALTHPEDGGIDPERIGTVFGVSKGDLNLLTRHHRKLLAGGVSPEVAFGVFGPVWPFTWPDCGAKLIAGLGNHRGPCLAPVAACATGIVAVLRAADLIRAGTCDIVFAGAGDSSLSPLVLGAFRRMGALARAESGTDPIRVVRPWHRRRSGFLVGAGAAILVLERADHARARGILPYAELAGGALGGDAYHLTDLDPDPANLTALVHRALNDAEASPTDIDYVNVHGTATLQNDPLECRAIRRAFGPHADSLSCSANKAQIGHLLGAAGAAELAITCLALRDSFVPPTLNLDDPDPACDLDGTPNVGRPRPIRAALKLSLGFGGHLAAVVLRRPDGPRREPPPHA